MKNRGKSMALIAAGIVIGAAVGGPVTQAAESIAAQRSAQKIYVDGQQVQMEAYNINGSNYVKLRDVGKAVGFNVSWDAGTKSVVVESDKPYTDDSAAQPAPAIPMSATVTLPTDGSKYTPKVGDRIPCDDGTVYEVKDVTRFENNVFAPNFDPELPKPTCDWSQYPTLELPRVDVRHISDAAGDDLFVRNLYETRRMLYTIYNALGSEPAAWKDGKLLTKIALTIPAEDEPYTKYFWPWKETELTKHVHAFPSFQFKIEAWDYYHNGIFEETRYYVDLI